MSLLHVFSLRKHITFISRPTPGVPFARVFMFSLRNEPCLAVKESQRKKKRDRWCFHLYIFSKIRLTKWTFFWRNPSKSAVKLRQKSRFGHIQLTWYRFWLSNQKRNDVKCGQLESLIQLRLTLIKIRQPLMSSYFSTNNKQRGRGRASQLGDCEWKTEDFLFYS